jgi:hypothetical protein
MFQGKLVLTLKVKVKFTRNMPVEAQREVEV